MNQTIIIEQHLNDLVNKYQKIIDEYDPSIVHGEECKHVCGDGCETDCEDECTINYAEEYENDLWRVLYSYKYQTYSRKLMKLMIDKINVKLIDKTEYINSKLRKYGFKLNEIFPYDNYFNFEILFDIYYKSHFGGFDVDAFIIYASNKCMNLIEERYETLYESFQECIPAVLFNMIYLTSLGYNLKLYLNNEVFNNNSLEKLLDIMDYEITHSYEDTVTYIYNLLSNANMINETLEQIFEEYQRSIIPIKLKSQINRYSYADPIDYTDCCICLLEKHQSDKAQVITKCKHIFHKECIEKVYTNKCPMCRQDLC